MPLITARDVRCFRRIARTLGEERGLSEREAIDAIAAATEPKEDDPKRAQRAAVRQRFNVRFGLAVEQLREVLTARRLAEPSAPAPVALVQGTDQALDEVLIEFLIGSFAVDEAKRLEHSWRRQVEIAAQSEVPKP